ncbi:hypothetical protein E4T52_01076 [Aureobasidium sp. EXF-3400]|nr:hypothetical protein E4T51_02903 [Aureobasidium sp. EXF-12344]KAI4784030.1 hypothetical protein E4T52_01076 [Aureobasidium sp. EXF-3400]
MPEMVFSTGEHKPARASRRRSDRISKITVGNVGGGGDGGDIQTSAVKPAEPEPDTLNKIMICVYRNSKRRFVQKEIWMMRPGRRESTFVEASEYLRKDATFFNALRTDTAFFKEIRWRYKHQLRGTFRQYLSFKTYGNNAFGLADIKEKVFSPVFMRIYNDPYGSLMNPRDYPEGSELKYDSWVSWFWRKRRAFVLEKSVDLAIELVEAYDPNRVLGGIAIALTIYFTLTITWLALGGDPGYVAGVMSFVLSILAVLVGLTGLYDWLDLGHMGGGKDFLVLDEFEFDEIDRDGWRGPGG